MSLELMLSFAGLCARLVCRWRDFEGELARDVRLDGCDRNSAGTAVEVAFKLTRVDELPETLRSNVPKHAPSYARTDNKGLDFIEWAGRFNRAGHFQHPPIDALAQISAHERD
jgi:hypothetical protein